MLDPRGVGEGNIVGGGSWDRGCWPGMFMPMGLWAAAGFMCIWLGWLLLIPVGGKNGALEAMPPDLGRSLPVLPQPTKEELQTRFH